MWEVKFIPEAEKETLAREDVMNIVVVNKRNEDEYYTLAYQRKTKYGNIFFKDEL